MKKKFLLAVDRFDQSFELVRYFSKIVSPEDAQVVLFHVALPVPDSFFDVEKTPAPKPETLPLNGWRNYETNAAEAFLEAAKTWLVQRGFPPSAVTIMHQPRIKGIARDIMVESQKEYTALLLGRSETHEKNDTTLGSVTTKLVHMCDHIPVAVVGSEPSTERLLIGIDRSEGAFRAVEFIAGALRNTQMEITLCHVIRSLELKQLRQREPEDYEDIFSPEHELKWQKINEEGIRPLLDRTEQFLINAGWPSYKIRRKVILEVNKRSQCLVDEMHKFGHGSIALGRRGTSVVREFFLGRVGLKVLNLALGRAVWIVN